MANVIGGVTFTEQVRILTPGDAIPVQSFNRALDGTMIVLSPATSTSIAKWTTVKIRFRFEPWSVVEGLMTLWRNNQPVAVTLDTIGSGTAYLSQGGISGIKNEAYGDDSPPSKVEGTFTDLWSGEVTFLLEK